MYGMVVVVGVVVVGVVCLVWYIISNLGGGVDDW